MILVVLTTLVSIAALQQRALFGSLMFRPYAVHANNEWYRLITHAFVHADWGHLFVNMLVLYVFGRNVEQTLVFVSPLPVQLVYPTLYLGGVLFATLPGMAKHRLDPGYGSVGASGAVSAVLFAQIILMPTLSISVLFIPDIPAWLFGILYLIYSYAMDKRGGDNIAHDAHFYGAVFGVVFLLALQPALFFNLRAIGASLGL
ncbi:MAG: rhomboid family intramembrane serine protease [Flavobacteriales bacterium]|nr:rhomboid family intramembrane serine protease [Flavobacteriales bacterium]MBK6549436.1 rhomboid family intramembrane serine protease [Flavobacteriales bacterium]MBK6883979.1 rhomboid family intramembrane serine protease [Flavobacteriales bacterium]MBK7100368.1 rhomboid family intramembrane serine protease [Flavobacteriales bacterium]MBK7111062.1 rhomboid family intramembrane serine protease [Flavobacteriales bacterium]